MIQFWTTLYSSVVVFLVGVSLGDSSFNNDLNTVLHVLTHETNALCLDGSYPSYYVRRGHGNGTHKWIIHLEGGGWCYDMEQCYLRSKTELGSSHHNSLHRAMPLYLSSDGHMNPSMYNWNTVHVEYCDGSSFAGDITYQFKVRSMVWTHVYILCRQIDQLALCSGAGYNGAVQRQSYSRSHHS